MSAQAVEDATQLSEEKYCWVGAMVKLSTELHTRFEIVLTAEAVLAGA